MSMANPTPWPIEDINKALALKAAGLTWREVGERFGKSRSSAQAACARYRGTKPKHQDNALCGPPIGLEMSEINFRKEMAMGSALLREACLDLFSKTANRYQIGMDDAMACHLGHHAPPKLERAPLKTSSAMRLAA
jgi:hypothetical protein